MEELLLGKIDEIITASVSIPRLERRMFPDREVGGGEKREGMRNRSGRREK